MYITHITGTSLEGESNFFHLHTNWYLTPTVKCVIRALGDMAVKLGYGHGFKDGFHR